MGRCWSIGRLSGGSGVRSCKSTLAAIGLLRFCTYVTTSRKAAPTYAATVESAVTIADWRSDGQDSGAPPRRGGHVPQSRQCCGVELQAASIRIAVVGDRF